MVVVLTSCPGALKGRPYKTVERDGGGDRANRRRDRWLEAVVDGVVGEVAG